MLQLGPHFLDGLWSLSVLGGQLSRAAEQLTSCGPPTLSSDCGAARVMRSKGRKAVSESGRPAPRQGWDDDPFAGAGTTCSHQYKLGHRTRRLKVELALALSPSVSLAGNCAVANQRDAFGHGERRRINNFWQARRTRVDETSARLHKPLYTAFLIKFVTA